ncbi:MAG: VOC family protein [Crocinitomicaceae bacterium]|nr:VOC family protein [Crocinitomicaceae bacterium]
MKINELKIYSSQLAEQRKFYSEVLGIACIFQSEEKATFQIGSSLLTIESKKNATPYHFAINIPSNKENEVLNWLKDRVTILTENGTELHDFDFWNAKAMYFYDPDMNIVEFIARKNLNIEREIAFDVNQLLCISEIGMPTLDIESKFQTLNELSNVQKYSGDLNRMLAFGDETGLFICINKHVKKWFPIDDEAFSSSFELDFSQGETAYNIKFENDEIRLIP